MIELEVIVRLKLSTPPSESASNDPAPNSPAPGPSKSPPAPTSPAMSADEFQRYVEKRVQNGSAPSSPVNCPHPMQRPDGTCMNCEEPTLPNGGYPA